ncbi:hypothetical protein VCV18_010602 [Metarhizium anisopliae]
MAVYKNTKKVAAPPICARLPSPALMVAHGDAGNANPLLQNLQPNDELYATASVQLAGSDAEEHMQIALLVGCLFLQITDLCLGLFALLALAASQTLQDETGLVLATNLDEPAGRFGHEPNDDEEQNKGYDLERHRKPPDE